MVKYLRTVYKVDGLNQKVILQVDSCKDCPLMKFHQDSCLATCRVFTSEQTNIVDDFVLDYDVNTGQIYGDIEIPKWCALAEHKDQLDWDSKTYTIHNDKVLTSDNVIFDRDLPVYVAKDLKPKEERDLLPAIIAATASFNLTPDEAYEAAYSEYDEYSDFGDSNKGTNSRNYTPPEPKYEICSLCGEEDETVTRNRNHGTCDSCWETAHDDDSKKKQAYINNFRIKRGEKFQKEEFNHSVLKTDNLEVIISL